MAVRCKTHVTFLYSSETNIIRSLLFRLLTPVDLHGFDNKTASHIALEACTAMYNGEDGLRLHNVNDVTVQYSNMSFNGRHGLDAPIAIQSLQLSDSQFVRNGEVYERSCGVTIRGDENLNTSSNIAIHHSAFRNNVFSGVCARNVTEFRIDNSSIVNTHLSSCFSVANVVHFNVNNTHCDTPTGTAYNVGNLERSNYPSIPKANSLISCPGSIAFYNTCCPKSCGKCGGIGCSQRAAGEDCCYSKARKKSSCELKEAPCTLPDIIGD